MYCLNTQYATFWSRKNILFHWVDVQTRQICNCIKGDVVFHIREDGRSEQNPSRTRLRCSPAVFHQLPWSRASYHFVVFWPTVWRVTRCCYKHVAVWQFISRAERLHHLRNHFRTCQHRISCCKCFYVLSVLPVSLHTVSLRDKWGKDCFQDKLTTAWLIFWPQ